jgi:hypothetical protein
VTSTELILAGGLPGANGDLATAAAVAVAISSDPGREPDEEAGRGVLFAELGAERGRGPTMLAADAARGLERELRGAGFEASARGRLTWLRLGADLGWPDRLRLALEQTPGAGFAVVHLPAEHWREAVECPELEPSAALVRADLPSQRSLAALAAMESLDAGLRVRIATRAPGRVGARRALAGIDPGGDAARRSARLARGLLAADSGQALPLALGGILAMIFCSLVLVAFGGAVTGKSRAQRAADLAALSAARSMRDDFDRLFVVPRLADGSPNPAHLPRRAYLDRASAAAVEAAQRNGVEPSRVRVEFPDASSFAPLRARAQITASLDLAGLPRLPVRAHAVAEATSPAAASAAPSAPAVASGGGYSGPLAYRQGEPMRPDVAAAFDRMAEAASAAGIALIVNSGFRSDAEQAALFAQNPDPRWVAPPGTSLHRCATELDLGPPAAYGWLAANAPRFGFLRRYSWEAWHFGYTAGPAPCSAAGDQIAGRPAEPPTGDGSVGAEALPAFVPARFREPLAHASARWNVSATLLAAQLMAESNFNPYAVSPTGASGIAQFMPATAAAYGLRDPFDASAAIDAQAHLMSDLLRQFGQVPLALAAYNAGPAPVVACGCVPSYPETQAYVARILGLIAGGGAIPAAPVLEVRLVA